MRLGSLKNKRGRLRSVNATGRPLPCSGANGGGAVDRAIFGKGASPVCKLAACFLIFSFALLVPVSVLAVDLHQYWDQRCQTCHGHSGQFARRFLRVDDGRLLGAHHGGDLDAFLRNHYLADELVGPVTAMLAAQVTTPALFAQKCAGCHGNAATFARKSLVFSNGSVVGISSGRKLVDHLSSHGGLAPDEISVVVESLTRICSEVACPEKR